MELETGSATMRRGAARARRTQAERRASTQQLLLDATVSCIVDLGLKQTSTTEVCRRAGVSRGAQLHHYPTKAELVAAAVEHLVARRHDEFRAAYARMLDGQPSVRAAVEALWRIYSGPTLHAWQELTVAARTEPVLRRLMVAVNQRFFALAQDTLASLMGPAARNDPDLAAATRLTLAILDGLALNQVLEEDDRVARGVLRLLERLATAWRQTHRVRGGDACRPRRPRS
jgi:AcrR family transcriptional regulator